MRIHTYEDAKRAVSEQLAATVRFRSCDTRVTEPAPELLGIGQLLGDLNLFQ